MEEYFLPFREGIIGIDAEIPTPGGNARRIVYADWTASGRCYAPIEDRIRDEIMPFLGNTHTETSATGMAMTHAYHQAREMIKKHVNAGPDDMIITAGSGMTRVINKFQRMLGLRRYAGQPLPPEEERPIVFITHMEHHSNHTSWLESIATVEIIQATPEGLVDLQHFGQLLEQYADRKLKIASVTACSNVTGICTPYRQIARMVHAAGGYCFVDFACSAPYVSIDMHPEQPGEHLDAVFFSPHKFLGGPGSTGVLIFHRALHRSDIPDNPGGGTVYWTDPWGHHKYVNDIEAREDGGTPAFLQTIRAALCVGLKEEMGVDAIHRREEELTRLMWEKLDAIPNVNVLAGRHKDRLPIFSFDITGLHYNLGVQLLNDKFGIQSRGGCSCAGTYGHYLYKLDMDSSSAIMNEIDAGNCAVKPGWIRVSLHPTLTNEEVAYIGDAIAQVATHHREWSTDYEIDYGCGGKVTYKSQAGNRVKQRMDDALLRPLVPAANVMEKA